ncbi:MAG: hypothetical protein R3F56_21320 [Planctomycetota bacterium]
MNPRARSFLSYGIAGYVLFLATFLYLVGFVVGLPLPRTVALLVRRGRIQRWLSEATAISRASRTAESRPCTSTRREGERSVAVADRRSRPRPPRAEVSVPRPAIGATSLAIAFAIASLRLP